MVIIMLAGCAHVPILPNFLKDIVLFTPFFAPVTLIELFRIHHSLYELGTKHEIYKSVWVPKMGLMGFRFRTAIH